MFSIVLSILAGFSALAEDLSLDTYLGQVEAKNPNLSSSKTASEAATLTGKEADLLFLPSLFAQAQLADNHFTNSMFPTYYQSIFQDTYNVGIREQTDFGLTASVSYLLNHQGYIGILDTTTGNRFDNRFWEGTPKIEATFSLWRNFLGSENKATADVTRSSNEVNSYQLSYQVKTSRAEAENAYVRLVSVQGLVKIYDNSYSHAKDILSWNQRRSRFNLGETSDLLQAEANLEAQHLSLQASLDDLRTASRNFNLLRNLDSDVVNETLHFPAIEDVKTPTKSGSSDDVKAAQAQLAYTEAQAKVGVERNKPTFELYGSLALNDREAEAGHAFQNSFAFGQQATVFGIRLNVPLAFGIEQDVVKGFRAQADAAGVLVAQKTFEEDVRWKDLVSQLTEAKGRYAIASKLAQVQKRKVENERDRLKKGRTTTYQTLTFEIDYNTAEATRIQAQATVLNLIARMKTFGDAKL